MNEENEQKEEEKKNAYLNGLWKGGIVTYLCMSALLVAKPNFNTFNVAEYEGKPDVVRIERIGRDAIRVDADDSGSYESTLRQYLNRNFGNRSDRLVERERIRNQVDWYEPQTKITITYTD